MNVLNLSNKCGPTCVNSVQIRNCFCLYTQGIDHVSSAFGHFSCNEDFEKNVFFTKNCGKENYFIKSYVST